MQFDYTPDAREQAGIDAQLAAYNAGNPDNQLDEAGFVLAVAIQPFYAQLANEFDPGDDRGRKHRESGSGERRRGAAGCFAYCWRRSRHRREAPADQGRPDRGRG